MPLQAQAQAQVAAVVAVSVQVQAIATVRETQAYQGFSRILEMQVVMVLDLPVVTVAALVE